MFHVRSLLLATLLPILLAQSAYAQVAPRHPLDGLTSGEFWTVYDVLWDTGHFDSLTKVTGVLFREPPKAEVLAWRPGDPLRREATAIIKQGPKVFEGLVDVAGRKLLTWREVPGVQANMTWDEDDAINDLLLNDARVRAALERRGLTDLRTIRCYGFPSGYYGIAEERGRRIMLGTCWDQHGASNNAAHRVEGLTVTVDIEARSILRITDAGVVPRPTSNDDYDAEALAESSPALPPIEVRQPMGRGFHRTGNQVSWQNWRFHVRVDLRVGLVVSLVHYVEGERERPVLYQGSLSEIFVPYMDSTDGWYQRDFIDAGEFFFEGLAEPLAPGLDCPDGADYFTDVIPDEHSFPRVRERVACLFERANGEVAWRHGREGTSDVTGRPMRELVLRMNATVDNYDYLFDWVFQPNGSIRIAVGVTGILEVKPVGSQSVGMDPDGRADSASRRDQEFGRLLAPHILGVNHDHFFSFRLDFDVDGPNNSLAVDQLTQRTLPASHPRRSLWVVDERIPAKEKDAQLDMSMAQPALWRIINPGVRGKVGYPVSYELVPDHNAMSLLSSDDWPARRAGFVRHHLWITPYSADERFAAGEYPTRSNTEYGLPAWTRANRPIANTDIVAWYTLGIHHIPRAEDWPVMPTTWHSFTIRPFDFFERNPTLTLPSTP